MATFAHRAIDIRPAGLQVEGGEYFSHHDGRVARIHCFILTESVRSVIGVRSECSTSAPEAPTPPARGRIGLPPDPRGLKAGLSFPEPPDGTQGIFCTCLVTILDIVQLTQWEMTNITLVIPRSPRQRSATRRLQGDEESGWVGRPKAQRGDKPPRRLRVILSAAKNLRPLVMTDGPA